MTEQQHPWFAAAEEAVRQWPVDVAEIKLVSESENIVFRVTSSTNDHYVFRLHRPGYHTLAELHAEHAYIAALGAADIHVPVPVLTSNGDSYGHARHGDEIRNAGLYEWVPGELLSALFREETTQDQLAAWFTKLGRLIAQTHNFAASFQPAAGFTRQSLDAEGLMGEQPFWPRFWDHPKIPDDYGRKLYALRTRLYQRLSALPTDPSVYGMIHADLHAHNVVIHDNELYIIDFDDAGFGWYQYDLAVALPQYDSPQYHLVSTAVYAGYRQVRPVDDSFFELVPLFGLVRALNSVGWALSRNERLTTEKLRPSLDVILKLAMVILD